MIIGGFVLLAVLVAVVASEAHKDKQCSDGNASAAESRNGNDNPGLKADRRLVGEDG